MFALQHIIYASFNLLGSWDAMVFHMCSTDLNKNTLFFFSTAYIKNRNKYHFYSFYFLSFGQHTSIDLLNWGFAWYVVKDFH